MNKKFLMKKIKKSLCFPIKKEFIRLNNNNINISSSVHLESNLEHENSKIDITNNKKVENNNKKTKDNNIRGKYKKNQRQE